MVVGGCGGGGGDGCDGGGCGVGIGMKIIPHQHVSPPLQVLQQRVLGNGSFGVIVLASDNQGGADVAVKMEVCLEIKPTLNQSIIHGLLLVRVVVVIEVERYDAITELQTLIMTHLSASGLQGAAAAA